MPQPLQGDFQCVSNISFDLHGNICLFLAHRRTASLAGAHQTCDTCPAHLSWDLLSIAYILNMSTLRRTSISGILSCHLMWRRFLRYLMWKGFNCFVWHLYTGQVLQAFSKEGRITAQYTFSLVCILIPLFSTHWFVVCHKLHLHMQFCSWPGI